MGTCSQPGYVSRDFCLKQGINFIIFCLIQGINFINFSNRVSFPPGVLGLGFWVFVLETPQMAHCSWWKRTSWWSSRTWLVFTSSLIILISRRRSFWTTRIWTSQFLLNNLPDDWIHRRKEIQNGCREITRVTVERERSGNYTENKTGLCIDRVKIKLDCVKIKTGPC